MKKLFYLSMILGGFMQTANAQWSIDSISAPSYNMSVTQNGSKAIFTSGSKFEVFDFTTNHWSTANISFARANVSAATANGKSYFGGGGFIGLYSYAFYKNVDIYNGAANTWSTTALSQARIVGASAGIGNKVMFAGGRLILSYSNKVDMFDVTTGVRTTYNLSQPRTAMAVGIANNKVVFAGGETGNIPNGVYTTSNKVDIYDNTTGTWSTALLSSKRELIAVGVVGNKILFAGGRNASGTYSNRVDIYDASTNTWSIASMSQPKYGIAVATSGNLVYFAGGTTSNSGALSNRVEIYNASTNTWSYVTISSPRMSMSVAQTPKRIMFGGGVVTWGNTGTDRIEVLDLTTNTWSVEYLSRPRLGMASASYGNEALFVAGAEVWSSYPQYSIISNRVDRWTDIVPRLSNTLDEGVSINTNSKPQFSIYPNPAKGELINVHLNQRNAGAYLIQIYDMIGNVVLSRTINAAENDLQQITISDLPSGNYVIDVIDENRNESGKMMIVNH